MPKKKLTAKQLRYLHALKDYQEVHPFDYYEEEEINNAIMYAIMTHLEEHYQKPIKQALKQPASEVERLQYEAKQELLQEILTYIRKNWL